ncbi:efflux RND transporter periplasmic adaptor subunit [Cytobacillus suaedae]|nr:efflux RND transporter periplasmic adaptor subunit [Cytobacillus suaedae]
MLVKKVGYYGITIILGSLILIGCAATETADVKETNREKNTEKVVDEVKETKSEETVSKQEITLKGVTEPVQEVAVSSSITGYIKELKVELGSYVERDQPLAVLDDSDLRYQIEQAKAILSLNKAEAQVRAMEQQISLNDTKVNLSVVEDVSPEITEHNNKISGLELELSFAMSKLNQEQSQLNDIQSLNQAEIEEINNSIDKISEEINLIISEIEREKELLNTKMSQQSKQKKELTETSNLQEKSNQIAKSRTSFEIQKAQNEIKSLEYLLSHLSILAPTNGFITEHNAIVGSASAANSVMFKITNIDQLFINVSIPEAFINKIKQGQEVSVTFPTLGKTVTGKIHNISIIANTNSQTFPIKVLIDNVNHEIKGGMAAQVSIVSE